MNCRLNEFCKIVMCAAVSTTIEGKSIALVIGNSKYKNSSLDNCVNDSFDLSKVLRRIGFFVTTVIDSDFEAMETAIDRFIEFIDPNAKVIFFFSGHGVQYENQNYLIPCDDDRIQGLSDLKYRAINAQKILDLMSNRNPFLIVFLLDCCRTYDLPNVHKTKSLDTTSKGCTVMATKAGMLIGFASAPGTVAIDHAPNSRNGMFTYHLLQHITRPEEELLMLLTDVSSGVVNDTGGKQQPYIISALNQRGIHLVQKQSGKFSESSKSDIVILIHENHVRLSAFA